MRLKSNRYDEIEREVLRLFEFVAINKFPIDCVDICRQIGIYLVPYSQLTQKQKDALDIGSRDGLVALWEVAPGQFTYAIYYNDLMPRRRVRFTLMHELAHIILGHTEHSELAESEANYFAKYALAPPPLVHMMKIGDYLDLAEVFDLSNECAYYAMKRYFMWARYGRNELQEHEIKIIALFNKQCNLP